MCLRGATVTSWPIWGTVSELARARQFVEVDVCFLLCSQAERQGEEEPTQPFPHQVRLSRKRQSH